MKKFGIILFGLVILSCQDIEDCRTDDNLDVMIVRFYDIETKQTKKVGFTIGSGSYIYGEGYFSDDSTAVALPLNPSENATTFFFLTDTSNHELEMSHDVAFSIFDPKCDPSITFINLDTIRYTFDSLSIPGTVTNIQLDTNVKIYF